ncbi:MAG TPA: hypothetical protein VH482_11510 [Thermomicrobiales bacterium]|jgi:hypothetical protein
MDPASSPVYADQSTGVPPAVPRPGPALAERSPAAPDRLRRLTASYVAVLAGTAALLGALPDPPPAIGGILGNSRDFPDWPARPGALRYPHRTGSTGRAHGTALASD